MPQVNADVVAKWMLWRARQEDPPRRISNKKLQKLIYYAQAWHLAEVAVPLFDDRIEAWMHGPVVPAIYHEYKRFGYFSITDVVVDAPAIDGDTVEHLENIWDVYARYDADYLELLSHQERPWQEARERAEFGNFWDNEITHESMRDFYSSLSEESDQDEYVGG